jgi:hypothetical protein
MQGIEREPRLRPDADPVRWRDLMDFDPVEYARTRLVPFLNAILELLEEEDQPAQKTFFASIRSAFEAARDATDLADGFMQLSMSAFLGFRFSSPVAMLLDQLLMHSQELTEVLSLDEREIH